MFSYIWPLVIIVVSNTVYQICAKAIPSQMNVYASMTVTYAVATVFSLVAFFVTSKGGNIFKEFSYSNWATFLIGVVITGLDWDLFLHMVLDGKLVHCLLFRMRF